MWWLCAAEPSAPEPKPIINHHDLERIEEVVTRIVMRWGEGVVVHALPFSLPHAPWTLFLKRGGVFQ